jgi:hypothetical protein
MAFQIARHPEAFSLDSRTRQKQPRKHASAHLAFIRDLPCLVTGTRPVEAAHIRYADPRYFKRAVGGAEKPDDKWAVPLSPDQHRKQHSMDEHEFWQQAGIDPVFVAALLWAHSGNDEIAEQIIKQARKAPAFFQESEQ